MGGTTKYENPGLHSTIIIVGTIRLYYHITVLQ